jgi:multidrug efflux pump subunit AcrA (membrane-fusion protein)
VAVAIAALTADDGPVEQEVRDDVLAPLTELEGMWTEVAASTEKTAAALEAQNAVLRKDIKDFLLEESAAVDALLNECEEESLTVKANSRRYNLVYDRQSAMAKAAMGLLDAKAKLDSLQKVSRQLEVEIRTYEGELERESTRSARQIAREEGRLAARTAQVEETKQRLLAGIEDLDYAKQTEASLKYRIESEKERRKEIQQDLDVWRERLQTGAIEHNASLTPRPSWTSLDTAPWGIPLRREDDEATSGCGGKGPTTESERARVLGCREAGGAGFASPLAVSTTAAFEVLAARLRTQQRISRSASELVTTFARLAAPFLQHSAPVASTYSVSAFASFVPSKNDLIWIRDHDGVVLPGAFLSSERLAALSFNLGRSVLKFLGRNPTEDDVAVALTAFLEAAAGSGRRRGFQRRPAVA